MAKTASNIKTLSYSPAVYAYVQHKTKSGWRYYDVSDDITSCSVNRRVNTESTFSISLLNPDGKYDGMFDPMDACTVFARKSGKKKVRLITGYITDARKLTAYPSDFVLSGKCSLYRLQKLYWDPHLESSYVLFHDKMSIESENWGGFERILHILLTEIGGMRGSDVRVGGIPRDVVEWAQRMFAAKQEDCAQAEEMLDDFYEVLQSTGVTGTSSGGSSTAENDTSAVKGSKGPTWIDKSDYDMSRDDFVEKWGRAISKRGKRYGGGNRPLAAYGDTMAAAAYDLKMDPRICWAVSVIESGAGQNCIKPHNAWGWGAYDSNPSAYAKSWSSWPKAIRSWSVGFSKGYSGFTDIVPLAKKYCSRWESWSRNVWAEMQRVRP